MKAPGSDIEPQIRVIVSDVGGWGLSRFPDDGVQRVRALVSSLIAFVESRVADSLVQLAVAPRISDTDRYITPRLSAWLGAAQHLGTNSVEISSLLTRARLIETIKYLKRVRDCLLALESGETSSEQRLVPLLIQLGESLRVTGQACAASNERGPDVDILAPYNGAVRATAWPFSPDDGWREDAIKLHRLLVILRCALADRLRPRLVATDSRELRGALPYLDAYLTVDGRTLANDPRVRGITSPAALPTITTGAGMTYANPVDLVRYLCADLELNQPHPDLVPSTEQGMHFWLIHARPLYISLRTLARLSSFPPPRL